MVMSDDLPFASVSNAAGNGDVQLLPRDRSGFYPQVSQASQVSGVEGWDSEEASPVVQELRETLVEGCRLQQDAEHQAHRCALRAEDSMRGGDLTGATHLHLAAAKAFLHAAEQVRDHTVLASSLLLLADSHAAQAEEATVRIRLTSDDPVPAGASVGVTPAAAYRAAMASAGAATAGARGGGGGESQETVGALERPHPQASGAPDMEDSIMRGPTGRKQTRAEDGYEELANKFKPQMDDLLELERHLAKLGMEGRTGRAGGGPGSRAAVAARLRAGGNGNSALGNPGGAHLSSALGESFCLLNQSVIFGGGIPGGFVGVNALSSNLNANFTATEGGGSGAVRGASAQSPQLGGSSGVYSPSSLQPQLVGNPVNIAASQSLAASTPVYSLARMGDSISSRVDVAERDGSRGANAGGRVGNAGVDSGRRTAGIGSVARQGGSLESRATGVAGSTSAVWAASQAASRDGLARQPNMARDRLQEEAQQGEIMRLLTCLKTLGDENVSLMKECEDRDKVRQDNEAVREEMRRFQLKYQERFTLLKKTLDEVVRSYPRLASAAGAGSMTQRSGTESVPKTPKEAEREIRRLAQSNRKLTAQVKKYEKYYLELCQKADSKRKDQLAQAKAARQQQLAHHQPAFPQQSQHQPQLDQQQQQQQQQQQRGSSPGTSSGSVNLRRSAMQHQQPPAASHKPRPLQPAQQTHTLQQQQQQQQQRRPPLMSPTQQTVGQLHYPALGQQHLLRHHQQQRQQHQQRHPHQQQTHQHHNRASPQGLAVYGPSLPSGAGGSMALGRGLGFVGNPSEAVQPGMMGRSPGLDQESEV